MLAFTRHLLTATLALALFVGLPLIAQDAEKASDESADSAPAIGNAAQQEEAPASDGALYEINHVWRPNTTYCVMERCTMEMIGDMDGDSYEIMSAMEVVYELSDFKLNEDGQVTGFTMRVHTGVKVESYDLNDGDLPDEEAHGATGHQVVYTLDLETDVWSANCPMLATAEAELARLVDEELWEEYWEAEERVSALRQLCALQSPLPIFPSAKEAQAAETTWAANQDSLHKSVLSVLGSMYSMDTPLQLGQFQGQASLSVVAEDAESDKADESADVDADAQKPLTGISVEIDYTSNATIGDGSEEASGDLSGSTFYFVYPSMQQAFAFDTRFFAHIIADNDWGRDDMLISGFHTLIIAEGNAEEVLEDWGMASFGRPFGTQTGD